MENLTAEIMDALKRAEDSGKEREIIVDNNKGKDFLLRIKPLNGGIGVEATLSPFLGKITTSETDGCGKRVTSSHLVSKTSINIGGKCNLKWIAEAIRAAVEW
jgi:hypothetical protein